MQLTMSNKLAAATAYCTRPQDLYTTQSDTNTHTRTNTYRERETHIHVDRQGDSLYIGQTFGFTSCARSGSDRWGHFSQRAFCSMSAFRGKHEDR